MITRFACVFLAFFALVSTATSESRRTLGFGAQITISQANELAWTGVDFVDNFNGAPVVIPSVLTSNDPDPAEVMLSDVTIDGVDVQSGEWEYQDGVHGDETIGLFLLEPGLHNLGGLSAEAGKAPISGSLTRVSFGAVFTSVPVVLAQLVSEKGDVTATVRLKNVDAGGFSAWLQTEEALGTAGDIRELHYVAIEEGSGSYNGQRLLVGKTGRVVSHVEKEVAFGEDLDSPLFYAQDQQTYGPDTSWVRLVSLSEDRAAIKIEEEQSANAEIAHTTEVVGWMAIGVANTPVTPVPNVAPLAVNDSITVTVAESVSVDVLSNDGDADGTINPQTVVAVSPTPQHGTLSIDSASGAITYTPNTNVANGTIDTFGYTVKDDAGDDSNIGIVTVTYDLPANVSPVAEPESLQVTSASAVTIDVISNDTDADGTIDPQTVVAASPVPQHGTVSIDAATGAITYTANSNIATDTVDVFGYQVSDDDGDRSNVATVTVTISPVAAQQLLTNSDFSNQLAGWNTCGNGSAVTVDGNNNAVVGNSNCILQNVDVTANQPLSLSCDIRRLSAGSEYAAVSMIFYDSNGSYLSEAPAAVVDSATFQTYTVSGTAPAGVGFAQVMVYTETGVAVSNCSLTGAGAGGGGGGTTPPNQLPIANNDTATISAGSAQSISVLSNDSDTDGTLDIDSVVITTQPANGAAVAQADGTVLYTHNGGTVLSDSFSYTVNDDDGDSSNTAQVTVTITPVVISTGLTAFHRHGQTFLTWSETDPLDGYHIYRHSVPITPVNLSSADKITSRWGPLDSNTSVNSYGGSNVPSHFVINDLGAALTDDTGLFVYTTQPGDSGNAHYAVTSVSNGVETISSFITTGAAVNESVSQPRDVLTVSVNQGKGRIYTQFMDYESWNPTFNGYAYNYTVALPSNYSPGTSYPLMLELHAHSEPYKFVDQSEYNWQVITLFPSDPGVSVGASHSWWYGYSRDHNYKSGTNPTSGPIENFTEQRIMRSIDSVIDDPDFNVDSNRVHGLGHSMGGSGVLSLGLRYGSILSGVYASQPMTNYNNISSTFLGEWELAWGSRAANLPIINSGPYSQDIAFYGVGGVQSVGVWDWMNHQKQLVDRRADDIAYLMTFHGKQDSIIDWQTQGQPLTQAFTDATAGFSARNYGNIPHTWVGFESVVTSLFGFGNGADFPWKYPLNLSYPAIQNASGSSAINPPNSGNDAYNMDIEWATPHTPFAASIVDQAKRYEISLRSTGAAQTADITPRRTQQFDPDPGQQCDWLTKDNNTGQVLGSGSSTVDVDSLLTIPDVSIETGVGTKLIIDCGSGQPIDPVDPIDPGTGVSCPIDVINVQAVLDDAFQGQGYFTNPLLTEPYDCVVSTYNQAGTISRVIEFANCSDPAVSQACLDNGGQTGPYYSVETESNCYIEGPDTGIEADTACIDQATGLPQYKSFSRASISLQELQQCAIDFGCDVDFTSP